ncbi:MAG: DNA polymerase III subunit delta' [Oscillospiraceae bacterium]|nr:DNA polymerase III subunit delta' [Oscillospiraceae bacterium]
MTLYSKDTVTKAVASMKRNNRMAHAFLLCGEKGTGKKTMAFYIAKTLMCENIMDGVPCGQCRHCRRIDQGMHPDVIIPERTGKTLIYSKQAMDKVYEDAFITPNDCDVKVFILPDCENMQERTQNKMLKLIEEPPEHAYFIFTAPHKNVFLPTIISRVITLGVSECTEDECRKALEDTGKYTAEQIEEAAAVHHGNIGCAMDYLDSGNGAAEVELCRGIINGLAGGDEYLLYKALYDMGEDRNRIKNVLSLTDKVIRDVCIIRLHGKENAQLTGCFREGAERLSERLSFRRAEEIHELLLKNIGYCHSNVNAAAAMASLCGELMG